MQQFEARITLVTKSDDDITNLEMHQRLAEWFQNWKVASVTITSVVEALTLNLHGFLNSHRIDTYTGNQFSKFLSDKGFPWDDEEEYGIEEWSAQFTEYAEQNNLSYTIPRG